MNPSSRAMESGSTLLVALMLSVVLMITLGTMLTLINSEYRMIHRAFYYGNAIYMAEAGVEEGIGMINNGNNNWGGNGWYSLGTTNYTKTVTNFTAATGGSAVGRYVVNVYGSTNLNPTIVCTGIVDATSTTVNGLPSPDVTRVVQVVLGKRRIFQWGLLSQKQVNLNGNDIEIDSFDSTDPNHSDYDYGLGFGTYDPAEQKDNGDVASNGGITNTIAAGNADVYGHALTGPGGSVSVGPGGFVAALGEGVDGEIDESRVSHSMNVDLPPPTLPSDWSPVNSASPYNINGGWSFYGGGSTPVDFVVSQISLSSATLSIETGYMRFYVTGDINVTGSSSIVIKPGAKLEIYVMGSTSIAGNGVANLDERATSFQLYGLSSADLDITGNGVLTGVIYAPLSDVTFKGGGSEGSAVGAVVGNTITLTGKTKFHYDESLKNNGPTRGYFVSSWQEL